VLVEIVAAIKAIATIAETLKEISDKLSQLKQDSIQKELRQIRMEVNETLDKIAKADSKEERRKLSAELAGRLAR